MFKAIKDWKDGEAWWMLYDIHDGTPSHAVATKEEAIADGATVFVELEEPRFLVRDESGRGGAVEVAYTDFTADEREYREEAPSGGS